MGRCPRGGGRRGGETLAQDLLEGLPSRFLLVVGKGGVGKTTTAGALALALAEGGSPTCLISTDPAHSLGDLFGTALSAGAPVRSPCSERLVVEELDSDGFASAWMARARRPLLELFDRGTYLDRADVEGFLDLTLPGVDEVAAALRLAELAEGDWARIVVDTAPTGHTLRLLDAGDVVRSWARAFDAMAEKAAAVIGQLTRRPVHLEADDLTRELEARVETFHTLVLARAAAVLVERRGSVVEAESRRLHQALEARGLTVGLRVRVGESGSPPAETGAARPAQAPRGVIVPFNAELVGCAGLRQWGEPGARSGSGRPSSPSRDAVAFVRGLPPLVLFVGKGGVGKSTCAAAAALALAEAGDVTLLGTDPAGSLGDVLAVDLVDGEASVGAHLALRQVLAAEEFQDLKARYRESVAQAFSALGLERAAALDRRVLESLMGLAPPGLDEVFAVAALLEERESARSRTVVDTAPTGHFLRFAATPRVALEWTHQLLRVIRKYRTALGLDAFAERLLDFAKQLKELNLTLADPARSAAIVVTQPGPLVAAESRRLLARLSEAGIRVAAVLENRTPQGASPSVSAPQVPALQAPTLEEPPVGPEALQAFLTTWSVLPVR